MLLGRPGASFSQSHGVIGPTDDIPRSCEGRGGYLDDLIIYWNGMAASSAALKR